MNTIAPATMIQRFKERAEAVRKRTIPPIAGAERKAFIQQAELDYQDFLLIADAEISFDGGVLTIDLRPAICDAVISGRSLEVETKTAMKNITDALPTDGAKITPKMLDSKSDLEDLMKGSEMFKVVETVDPIKPVGFSFSHGYLP